MPGKVVKFYLSEVVPDYWRVFDFWMYNGDPFYGRYPRKIQYPNKTGSRNRWKNMLRISKTQY